MVRINPWYESVERVRQSSKKHILIGSPCVTVVLFFINFIYYNTIYIKRKGWVVTNEKEKGDHGLLPLFWGKTESTTGAVHPAVAHMLDVGIMAQEMFVSFATQQLDAIEPRLALEQEKARRCIGLLAALHDIGKISPGFQKKRPDLCVQLREAGFSFSSAATEQHGQVARKELPAIFEEQFNMDEDAAYTMACVLAGHHGSIPGQAEFAGNRKWKLAREDAADFLARCFGVDDLAEMQELSTSQQFLFAGLVSIADWLASAEEHFPYSGGMPTDIEAYMQQRRIKARHILSTLCFHTYLNVFPGFSALFGFEEPNPCQKALLELGQSPTPPRLVILESPMGSGKTEAALGFYAAAAQTLDLRGMYCALPTQATSNAMLRRINDFLERAASGKGAELQLLHAHAALNADYENLCLSSIGEDEEAKVAASSWFARSKRGLLAGCGVGTIDQALLAALQVRHFFVRLFGLSGKLLLLDEVHAYDAYMDEEIKRLLGWARLCGVTVVLLSATLPQRKRQQFVQAFAPEAHIEDEAVYPCALGVHEDGAVSITNIEGIKPATLEIVPHHAGTDKADTAVYILKDVLPEDGCAACIMNTVGEAQEVYRRLQNDPHFQDCPVYLFHARFSLERRGEIERDLLSRFGKGDQRRPKRAVVVATQVIEQSLDLDFDVMVSDLAPIDLLLQRAGRMHRHDRGERLHPRALHILVPDLSGTTVDFGLSAAMYHADILLLTAALFIELNKNENPLTKIINLPYDLSAWIEAVYGDTPVEVPEHLEGHLQKLQSESRGSDQGSSLVARFGTLEEAFLAEANPEYVAELSNAHEDDLLAISTREGRERVSVVIVQENESLECGTWDEAKTLFSKVLSTDKPFLVQYCRGVEPPESWQQNAFLRHCRPLIFRNGEDTAGLGLHYDAEYGLQFPQNK